MKDIKLYRGKLSPADFWLGWTLRLDNMGDQDDFLGYKDMAKRVLCDGETFKAVHCGFRPDPHYDWLTVESKSRLRTAIHNTLRALFESGG